MGQFSEKLVLWHSTTHAPVDIANADLRVNARDADTALS